MKKFAYLFTLGDKIVWSSETEVSLVNRMKSEPSAVREEVGVFIQFSKPGDHIQIPSGEFIFCTANA